MRRFFKISPTLQSKFFPLFSALLLILPPFLSMVGPVYSQSTVLAVAFAAVEPSPEICDGIDNDLNGLVDEGFPDTDGDTMADCVDPDDDNDGIPDATDACPLDPEDFDGFEDFDGCPGPNPPPPPTPTPTPPPSPTPAPTPTPTPSPTPTPIPCETFVTVPDADPSTFTVNSTCDEPDATIGDGFCDAGLVTNKCTLRAAIAEANSHPNTNPATPDTINFSMGSGTQTIAPLSALPTLIDPVIIDGTTQPGFAGTPIVELSGVNVSGVNGLHITSGDSTVQGLVINRFPTASTFGMAIRIGNNGRNTIKGNFIGTDVTGSVAQANGFGILIENGSNNNTIGGTSAVDRNIIYPGNTSGVEISGDGTDNNTIIGNYIGVRTDGSAVIAGVQGNNGIRISNGSKNNDIGGNSASRRNIISGNSFGVKIDNAGSENNRVMGNYIGSDSTGTVAIGNSVGVRLGSSSQHNNIGGPGNGDGNIISGNQNGIEIHTSAKFNSIEGNQIGLKAPLGGPLARESGIRAAESEALPNSVGIYILLGSQDNTVGGATTEEFNTIAHNTGEGIHVDGQDTTGNTLSANSIYDNGTGINNSNGGNGELAAPVVTETGSAGGTSCALCKIDIYSDDGNQGRIYEATVYADSDGNWHYPGAVTGPNVTAIATDGTGNSSEFSIPATVPAA